MWGTFFPMEKERQPGTIKTKMANTLHFKRGCWLKWKKPTHCYVQSICVGKVSCRTIGDISAHSYSEVKMLVSSGHLPPGATVVASVREAESWYARGWWEKPRVNLRGKTVWTLHVREKMCSKIHILRFLVLSGSFVYLTSQTWMCSKASQRMSPLLFPWCLLIYKSFLF